ncbi:hypothetical protein SAMN05192533_1293 [Mesobacillus persicus]|uniref:Uncharacterized protein n=1 Tax=Mesobacillus persicus TaxID=930146 RepID=A0A1H8KM56_9BACI|nr:hypothetical protein [Mesobacillus persicus]SEN94039.1 hypothetical protein SAMN05192533_1293 [Mesobacillus persicus]
MIWLVILIPVLLIGGIAVYFEKKTGMTPPEGSTDKQIDKMAEVKAQTRKDMGGGNNGF